MSSGVILLCAGQQMRLDGLGYPKQMIEVAGEPILLRTVRLIRETLGGVPICVAARPDQLSDVCRQHDLIECTVSARPMMLNVEYVMRAQQWERAIVLLGDVCWSRRLIRLWLQQCSERPTLYCARVGSNVVTGKPYAEHFAIECSLGDLRRLDARRYYTMRDAARTRIFGALRLIEQPVDDYTEDFDTPDDVTRLVPLLSKLVKKEAA